MLFLFRFRKKVNVTKERAYPEYQFKPTITGYDCVNLRKIEI